MTTAHGNHNYQVTHVPHVALSLMCTHTWKHMNIQLACRFVHLEYNHHHLTYKIGMSYLKITPTVATKTFYTDATHT